MVGMFSRELLDEAYQHMEWADAMVWSAVPAGVPIDPRLRWLLVHTHTVQRAFLAIWTGRPVQEVFRDPDSFNRLEDVRIWAQPVYADARACIEQLSAERLLAPLQLPWAEQIAAHIGRPPNVSTLGETCYQVANHSTYHRGQTNARLRELGVDPPLVDYIAWVWIGKPAPEWPPVGEPSHR